MNKKNRGRYPSLPSAGPGGVARGFPASGFILCAGIYFFLVLVAMLAVSRDVSLADAPKAELSFGKPGIALYVPDPGKNRIYRQRVKELMRPDNYLLSQWRQRRSYPYSDRAMSMIRAGRKAAALDAYNTYLACDPKHLLIQWERLVLLGSMQDPARTEAAASEFLRLVPGFGPALILRAFARGGLARMLEAESDWAAALKDQDLTPGDHSIVLGQLSFAAYRRGDFKAAARWCRQWIGAGTDDVARCVFYAGLLEKMDHWQAAVDQWRRIAGMDPAGTVLRRSVLARGVLLQKVRKPRAAFAVLMAAREHGLFDGPEVPAPQRLEFARMLAVLAEKAGRIDVAVEALEGLPRSLLGDAGRLDLARLYTLRADPGRVISLIFDSPPVSLADEDTLVRMLDLARLLDRESFAAAAAYLMDKSLPAARLRFRENQHAKEAQQLWIDYLAADADISSNRGRWRRAAASLAELARLTGKYRYEMDYAALLLANQRPGRAVTALQRTAGRTDLPPEHQARACAALAEALTRCGRHAEAARAWQRAYLLSGDPLNGLYCSEAFRKAGDLRSAEASLENFPVRRLKPGEQLIWYETAGRIWRQCGSLEKSLQAWRKAADLSPRAFYAYQVGDILLAMNRPDAADAVLAKVLRSAPHDREALKRRAYIQTRLGNDTRAAAMFEDLLRTGDRDYRILADLGFAWARLGDNRRSLMFLRQAADRAPGADDAGPQQEPSPADPLPAIRREIAEMDRPLELTLTDSVHWGAKDTPRTPTSSEQWFNRGGGMLEAAFRPARLGYRNGRTLALAGRLVWPNRPDTLQPEGDGLQAGFGVRYKPLRGTNLLLCSEYLLGIGEDRDNQVLLRIAHSSTRVPARARRGSAAGVLENNTYRHHYTESGKVFGGDGYWFATHETRLGKAYFIRGKTLMLPFGYLLGDGVLRSGSDFFQAEAGAGISVRWSGGFDRYRGNRRQAECLVRGGYTFYANEGGPGWNVLLGVRLSFF